MKYKWVFTKDWYGKVNQFRIVHLVDHGSGIYGCSFVNSNGDIEKKAVNVQELYQ